MSFFKFFLIIIFTAFLLPAMFWLPLFEGEGFEVSTGGLVPTIFLMFYHHFDNFDWKAWWEARFDNKVLGLYISLATFVANVVGHAISLPARLILNLFYFLEWLLVSGDTAAIAAREKRKSKNSWFKKNLVPPEASV